MSEPMTLARGRDAPCWLPDQAGKTRTHRETRLDFFSRNRTERPRDMN
jgi:hypothetical protein